MIKEQNNRYIKHEVRSNDLSNQPKALSIYFAHWWDRTLPEGDRSEGRKRRIAASEGVQKGVRILLEGSTSVVRRREERNRIVGCVRC